MRNSPVIEDVGGSGWFICHWLRNAFFHVPLPNRLLHSQRNLLSLLPLLFLSVTRLPGMLSRQKSERHSAVLEMTTRGRYALVLGFTYVLSGKMGLIRSVNLDPRLDSPILLGIHLYPLAFTHEFLCLVLFPSYLRQHRCFTSCPLLSHSLSSALPSSVVLLPAALSSHASPVTRPHRAQSQW